LTVSDAEGEGGSGSCGTGEQERVNG